MNSGETDRLMEPAPRYVLVRPLGQGGMGHVDLVQDRVRGELVARKRILAANMRPKKSTAS